LQLERRIWPVEIENAISIDAQTVGLADAVDHTVVTAARLWVQARYGVQGDADGH
jgi:hypothetical protein